MVALCMSDTQANELRCILADALFSLSIRTQSHATVQCQQSVLEMTELLDQAVDSHRRTRDVCNE
jgi:hypothetical protein